MRCPLGVLELGVLVGGAVEVAKGLGVVGSDGLGVTVGARVGGGVATGEGALLVGKHCQ